MSVLIEFVKDTDKRKKGDRVTVDDGSAKSLVTRKKVAKRVTDAQLKEEARRAAAGVVDEDELDDEDETSESEESGETAEQSAGGAS